MDPKKIIIGIALLLSAAPLDAPLYAKDAYKSALKRWTRTDKVYVMDNFEARMIWSATYLSQDFRAARREKLTELLEWDNTLLARQIREDAEESREFDAFFVGIYAGSSKWPDIGKNTGQWRILLERGSGPAMEAMEMERIAITQIERELFPYLDKWSHAFYVRFPKTLVPGDNFRIRMAGNPAKSQLSWE